MEQSMQLPSRSTAPPYVEHTYGHRLASLIESAWVIPERKYMLARLTPFQRWLLNAVLECDAAGNLRYRTVVISMPRKNSKSLVASWLALYGMLLHDPSPAVVSAASNRDQAKIVYNAFLYQCLQPRLKPYFKKATELNGIHRAQGLGSYHVYPAKASSLQGLNTSMNIIDELHVVKPETFNSLVLGQATRQNPLTIGITTAGDASSTLLKSLYHQGDLAVQGHNNKFGFFVWEASSDDFTDENILMSNPGIPDFMDLETARHELHSMPRQDAIRYRLNRFVESTDMWLPQGAWVSLPYKQLESTKYVAIDRTPSHSHAFIVAHDGKTVETIAVLNSPSQDDIVRIVQSLDFEVCAVDGYMLKDVSLALKNQGRNVVNMSLADIAAASNYAYKRITEQSLSHDHNKLLDYQVERGVRKNVGDSWRVSRKDSVTDIDGLMAMLLAVYVKEIYQTKMPMVY